MNTRRFAQVVLMGASAIVMVVGCGSGAGPEESASDVSADLTKAPKQKPLRIAHKTKHRAPVHPYYRPHPKAPFKGKGPHYPGKKDGSACSSDLDCGYGNQCMKHGSDVANVGGPGLCAPAGPGWSGGGVGANSTGGQNGYPCHSQSDCSSGNLCLDVSGANVGYGETGICGSAPSSGWADGSGAAPSGPTYGAGSSCTSDAQCGAGLGCDTTIGPGACREFTGTFCGADADCSTYSNANEVFCTIATHQCTTYKPTAPGGPSDNYCPCSGYPNTPDATCAALDCYNESWQECGLASPPPYTPCIEGE